MELSENNIYLKKALKYYLKLKSSNNEKHGLEYASRTLENISKIKNIEHFRDIVEETENYCNNYIKNTIMEDNYLEYKMIIKYIDEGNIIKIKNSNIRKEDLLKFDYNGDTILHYCIKLGDYGILKILLENDVSINTINKNGNTLIEYAVLLSDPNMIKFLTDYGSNIKKNLFLRDKIKNKKSIFKLKTDNIDVACIVKQLLIKSYNNKINEKFNKLKDLVDFNINCGFGNFTLENILIGISVILDDDIIDTYIEIILEEIKDGIGNKIYCYNDMMEIIIYNLMPFYDDYEFNLSHENLFLQEFYFLKKRYNKKHLMDKLFENYIDKLMPENFIGIQIKKILR